MTYQLLADDGSPIDAHFDLEDNAIIFHSRGGAKGQNARNVDYSSALRLLLLRLSQAGASVHRAFVDSSQVQSIPVEERLILSLGDVGISPDRQASLMASRMQAVGRKPSIKSAHGNSTKRIRIEFNVHARDADIISALKAVRTRKDFRSQDRLPISELAKVTHEHIWNAVQLLRGGGADHEFGESTDFDLVLDDGSRLPPKAVFGIAASQALGMKVLPRHFSAGIGTPCFNTLAGAGYQISPKEEAKTSSDDSEVINMVDLEWREGTPRLRKHLRRERGAGLRQAKIAEFRRTHGGKLFCERCSADPIEQYATKEAEACIEVHHKAIQVANMEVGHATKLEDLQCLCANCHRLEHRLGRLEERAK